MRGFITIATGAEYYYKLARQLLRSYRCNCKDGIPFALVCDDENEYTAEFDNVIVMDQAHRSYMDKLLIYQYSPFEETIFIDADSLILNDPAVLWEDFCHASPVSCYGELYPIGSDKGWFRYDRIGHWKEIVKHQIGLHGGIYYFRKDDEARSVFETAIQLAQEYDNYGFVEFLKPADEPVMALSLAIHGCNPVKYQGNEGHLLFLHTLYGRLSFNAEQGLLLDGTPNKAIVCHFATKNTYCYMYHYMSEMVNMRYLDPSSTCVPNSWAIRKKTLKNDIKNWMEYVIKRTLRRILPVGKLKAIVFRRFHSRTVSAKDCKNTNK